jgi:hypothetical protein
MRNSNYWPAGLMETNYECFECFFDIPDKGDVWLVHAFAGGVDVIDYLDHDVKLKMEKAAYDALLPRYK